MLEEFKLEFKQSIDIAEGIGIPTRSVMLVMLVKGWTHVIVVTVVTIVTDVTNITDIPLI